MTERRFILYSVIAVSSSLFDCVPEKHYCLLLTGKKLDDNNDDDGRATSLPPPELNASKQQQQHNNRLLAQVWSDNCSSWLDGWKWGIEPAHVHYEHGVYASGVENRRGGGGPLCEVRPPSAVHNNFFLDVEQKNVCVARNWTR
uniref:Secreted protein n=1 Tax=Globodera rostochiensis TaxID=31243 RepID=A0A914IDG1_GLORO